MEGRKHIDVQTELYLEELSDRVEEADVETQTDAFLDRPPSPLFIPSKSGVDVATQILEGEVCCYHFYQLQLTNIYMYPSSCVASCRNILQWTKCVTFLISRCI